MDSPNHIEFLRGSKNILSTTLIAATPQEGCAILVGKSVELKDKEKHKVFKIEFIWPSENIWISGFHDDIDTYLETKEQNQKTISRENRFALDPNEQLFAQKWANSGF